MPVRLAALCVAISAALPAASLVSAQATKELATEAQYPAQVNAVDVDVGYKWDYKPGAADEGYQRISYKGSLVRSKGTPFKYARGADFSEPEPVSTTAGGDRNDISLRFEKGTATVGGGLFEASGVAPFKLRGLDALDLRGTALLAGDADSKKLQIAGGLESPSIRVPGFANSQTSNWIVLGINAQRQEATDTATGDKNFGLFTFRAFLGKAFGWRKSGDVGKTAEKLANDILQQAKTYEIAVGFVDKIKKIPVLQRTNAQKLLLDALANPEAKANWVETVKALSRGEAEAILDQPTVAIYGETSGWYAMSEPPEGSRLKNLFTLTLDYWLLPKRDDVFLRLRYETGFERALPNERKNHVLASLGFRF